MIQEHFGSFKARERKHYGHQYLGILYEQNKLESVEQLIKVKSERRLNKKDTFSVSNLEAEKISCPGGKSIRILFRYQIGCHIFILFPVIFLAFGSAAPCTPVFFKREPPGGAVGASEGWDERKMQQSQTFFKLTFFIIRFVSVVKSIF